MNAAPAGPLPGMTCVEGLLMTLPMCQFPKQLI